jgi:hypothetical protein
MDLESARGFAEEKDKLDDEMRSYSPDETGFEHLSPNERFNLLWDTFDQLAAEAPSYDGIHREEILLSDARVSAHGNVSLKIARNISDDKVYRQDANVRRIYAEWSSYEGVLHSESLDNQLLGDNERTRYSLAVMEETAVAAQEMLQEYRQRMELIRNHRISTGHP